MVGNRRSFRRRPRRTWLVFVLFIGLALLRWGHDRWQGVPQPLFEPPLAEGDYIVLRVVDGDTLLVAPPPGAAEAGRELRLRLLGIDCPESVKPNHPVEPWGREAAEFTRQFVSGGAVRLRFDKRRLDQYDRYLAYVFVADKMLNEELVRAGLAHVLAYPGDSESMTRRLRAAEQEARQSRRGIWSEQPVRPAQRQIR
jgi:endonuclease YncB( thermonuclease family)